MDAFFIILQFSLFFKFRKIQFFICNLLFLLNMIELLCKSDCSVINVLGRDIDSAVIALYQKHISERAFHQLFKMHTKLFFCIKISLILEISKQRIRCHFYRIYSIYICDAHHITNQFCIVFR